MPNGGLHGEDYPRPTLREMLDQIERDRDYYKEKAEQEKARADKFQKLYGTLRTAMDILKDKEE